MSLYCKKRILISDATKVKLLVFKKITLNFSYIVLKNGRFMEIKIDVLYLGHNIELALF